MRRSTRHAAVAAILALGVFATPSANGRVLYVCQFSGHVSDHCDCREPSERDAGAVRGDVCCVEHSVEGLAPVTRDAEPVGPMRSVGALHGAVVHVQGTGAFRAAPSTSPATGPPAFLRSVVILR